MRVEPRIVISAGRVLRVLMVIIAVLALASIAGQLLKYLTGHGRIYGLVPLFDLNREANVPTVFSTAVLLLAAALLAVISLAKRTASAPFVWHWVALAIVFIFLAVDEASSIHELLTYPVRNFVGATGLLYYAWVIPYTALAVVLVLCYWSFLLHLPMKTRRLFVVSGMIYMLGAVGMELLGGRQDELYGSENLAYSFLVTLEEVFEMIGASLFVYALLDYLGGYAPDIRLHLQSGTRGSPRKIDRGDAGNGS